MNRTLNDIDMLNDYKSRFEGMARAEPRTESVEVQLVEARIFSNWLGLYDAADYIKGLNITVVRDKADDGLTMDWLRNYPRSAQAQDSTRNQVLRLAFACEVAGLHGAAARLNEAF